MPEYLISFNDEWVPDLTAEQIRAKAVASREVIRQLQEAGGFIYSNGALDASSVLCSVEAHDGEPVFTDGPRTPSVEHLGGFVILDVADDEEARSWAGRFAVALDWPQEVQRFPRAVGRHDRDEGHAVHQRG